MLKHYAYKIKIHNRKCIKSHHCVRCDMTYEQWKLRHSFYKNKKTTKHCDECIESCNFLHTRFQPYKYIRIAIPFTKKELRIVRLPQHKSKIIDDISATGTKILAAYYFHDVDQTKDTNILILKEKRFDKSAISYGLFCTKSQMWLSRSDPIEHMKKRHWYPNDDLLKKFNIFFDLTIWLTHPFKSEYEPSKTCPTVLFPKKYPTTVRISTYIN